MNLANTSAYMRGSNGEGKVLIVQHLPGLLEEMGLWPDNIRVAYYRALEMEGQELFQTMIPAAFGYFVRKLGSENKRYRYGRGSHGLNQLYNNKLWFEYEGTTGLGNLSKMLPLHVRSMYEMLQQFRHPLCVVSPWGGGRRDVREDVDSSRVDLSMFVEEREDMPAGGGVCRVSLWVKSLYARLGRNRHENRLSGLAYSEYKRELVDACSKIYQMECWTAGHVLVLRFMGSAPEVGQYRSKSELIDRAAIQLGEEVDPIMMAVSWATATSVQIDGMTKEGIQALCILVEREHHPEIRRVFLCLDMDRTGIFPATYRVRVAPVEGHDKETQEAIAPAALAYQEWRKKVVSMELAGIP